jgi:hypothetical protein
VANKVSITHIKPCFAVSDGEERVSMPYYRPEKQGSLTQCSFDDAMRVPACKGCCTSKARTRGVRSRSPVAWTSDPARQRAWLAGPQATSETSLPPSCRGRPAQAWQSSGAERRCFPPRAASGLLYFALDAAERRVSFQHFPQTRYTDKAKLTKSSMPRPATNGPARACQRGGPTCAGGNPLRNLAMSPPK